MQRVATIWRSPTATCPARPSRSGSTSSRASTYASSGARAVDEVSLFAAIDEMREIERQAQTLTRTARRNRTRRQAQHDATATVEHRTALAPASPAAPGPVRPFDDIELW